MTAVIAVQNEKGGVGKTTTTFHLSGALAKAGYRVLCIDLDPQASLTNGFFGPWATAHIDPERTTYAIVAGYEPSPTRIVVATDFAGLDLVPGSASLKLLNAPDPLVMTIDYRCRLRDFVETVDGYDFVIIDGPPNLYLFAWQSFSAATHVLIPTQAEDFGSQGLRKVLEFAEQVAARPGEEGNTKLAWLGGLLNLVDRRSASHRVFSEDMREVYPGGILETVITRLNPIHEAITERKPLAFWDRPAARPARLLYEALATEVFDRVSFHECAFPTKEVA